jgi:hypothetical protein
MKAVLTILSAVVLSSAIASVAMAQATATDGIVCYSGGTAVFTDATVNVPVIVAPVAFGDPNDLYTATDSATGVQTTVGGSGTVCVVTYTPASSSSSKESKAAGSRPGIAKQ